MERAIVHMDLDTFFVSCERLKNSELEKKPVIIGGGDRGVVASCSTPWINKSPWKLNVIFMKMLV